MFPKTRFVVIVLGFGFVLAGCQPQSTLETPPSIQSTSETPPSEQTRQIIGFYTAWSAARGYHVADIDAEKLTRINYAFSNVSPSGECVLGDAKADVEQVYSAADSVDGKDDSTDAGALRGNFHQLQLLKQKFPQLKATIALGGWTYSSNFSAAALTVESRQKLVQSCIDLYLIQYPGVFDGIDMDWEYPVSGGLTNGQAADKQNLTLLMEEFRTQLDAQSRTDKKEYTLSIDMPASPFTMGNYEREKINKYVDYMSIMTYDLHGAWDQVTDFNAPLYSSPNSAGSSALSVDVAMQDYLAAGIPAEKLIMGVPFYGRGWQGVPNTNNGLYQKTTLGASSGTSEAGVYTYTDIKENYLTAYDRYWDSETLVPWLYSAKSGIMISYDDPESLGHKADYVLANGLSGVMIWELSQGDSELIDAIYSRLTITPPNPPEPTSMLPTLTPAGAITPGAGTFFDDFTYASASDSALKVNGWSVRTETVGKLNWSADSIQFLDDPAQSGNRWMQLTASYDGTSLDRKQAGISQPNKFFQGTYAARMYFNDEPSSGPAGDKISQSFGMMSQGMPSSDPLFSMLDFAYLPDGRVETNASQLQVSAQTETQQPAAGLQGWHTVVLQAGGGSVKYFIDGKLKGAFPQSALPKSPMAMGFQITFLKGGIMESDELREYSMQVDWVLYTGQEILTAEEADSKVAAYRAQSTALENNVAIFLPTNPPTLTRIPAGPRPFEASIPRVSTIAVDGDLKDWSGEPIFIIDNENQIVHGNRSLWTGPDDLSVKVWAGWSEAGLYFAFEVKDDVVYQEWTGAKLFNGDYMELQIDTQLEADYTATVFDKDDYQIGFTPGDFAKFTPEWYVWFGVMTEDQMKTVQQAQTQTPGGYVMEVFLPKETLHGILMRAEYTFGLNVNPSDCDKSAGPQEIMMSTSPTRKLSDPTTLGKITMLP